MPRILIVDDEPSILSVLGTLLKAQSHEVTPARSGEAALNLLKTQSFDLMISDIRMGSMDGMQLLQHVRRAHPGLAVIMLTAFGTVEIAVEAMKLGAADFLPKPFSLDHLMAVVRKALEVQTLREENVRLKDELGRRYRSATSSGRGRRCRRFWAR